MVQGEARFAGGDDRRGESIAFAERSEAGFDQRRGMEAPKSRQPAPAAYLRPGSAHRVHRRAEGFFVPAFFEHGENQRRAGRDVQRFAQLSAGRRVRDAGAAHGRFARRCAAARQTGVRHSPRRR